MKAENKAGLFDGKGSKAEAYLAPKYRNFPNIQKIIITPNRKRPST